MAGLAPGGLPLPTPRDALEGGEGGLKGGGGVGWDPPPPRAPYGPRRRRAKKLRLESSWRRSKLLPVSLKHWKGGGGGGGYRPPCTAILMHHCPPPPPMHHCPPPPPLAVACSGRTPTPTHATTEQQFRRRGNAHQASCHATLTGGGNNFQYLCAILPRSCLCALQMLRGAATATWTSEAVAPRGYLTRSALTAVGSAIRKR